MCPPHTVDRQLGPRHLSWIRACAGVRMRFGSKVCVVQRSGNTGIPLVTTPTVCAARMHRAWVDAWNAFGKLADRKGLFPVLPAARSLSWCCAGVFFVSHGLRASTQPQPNSKRATAATIATMSTVAASVLFGLPTVQVVQLRFGSAVAA